MLGRHKDQEEVIIKRAKDSKRSVVTRPQTYSVLSLPCWSSDTYSALHKVQRKLRFLTVEPHSGTSLWNLLVSAQYVSPLACGSLRKKALQRHS